MHTRSTFAHTQNDAGSTFHYLVSIPCPFLKMCLKHLPDNEFSNPPFLCNERMCIWYTPGACSVMSHDFLKKQLILKKASKPKGDIMGKGKDAKKSEKKKPLKTAKEKK